MNLEIRTDQDEAFWEAVRLCLEQFHHYDRTTARKAAQKFFRDMERVMTNTDLLYHEEPFYTACDIAHEEMRLADFREAYDRILRKAAGAH